jgi:transcriptional regulator GlxA family with amidase domain
MITAVAVRRGCGPIRLLRGRRATSHWTARPYLHHFGAVAVNERVVDDGDLVTAAGVTAGIEIGLLLAGRLRGPGYADALSLQAETVTGPRDDLDRAIVDDMRELFSGLMHDSLAATAQNTTAHWSP